MAKKRFELFKDKKEAECRAVGKNGRQNGSHMAAAFAVAAALFLAGAALLWQAENVRQREDRRAAQGGTFPVQTDAGAQGQPERIQHAAQGSVFQVQTDAGAQGQPEGIQRAAQGGAAPADSGQARNMEQNGQGEREGMEREEKQKIALTFDDGPHPEWTARLLDGLKEREIPATFFVVGKNIPGNEELIRRMDAEGHLIGNHTYDHVRLSDLDDEEACSQVEKTSMLIRGITGKDTEFVRPPFGVWKKTLECSFEMIPVLWTVDPLDWTTENTALVVQRVLEKAEPGGIILLHDCYRSSEEAALQIADALLARNYEFVTVDQLLLE